MNMVEQAFREFQERCTPFPPNYSAEQRDELRRWFEFFWDEWQRVSGEVEAEGAGTGLEALSYVDVRRRMVRLSEEPALGAGDAALLCGWVDSLGGQQEFCSSEAPKLYGVTGRGLNANHFNRLAKRGAHGRHGGRALLRWVCKGIYAFTPEGRIEGERVAQEFLYRKQRVDRGETGGGNNQPA